MTPIPRNCTRLVSTLFALVSGLHALPLPVVNGSFESELLPNPQGDSLTNHALPGVFTGWGALAGGVYYGSPYTDAYGSVTDSTALFTSGLTGTNAIRPSGKIYLRTDNTYVAGVTYTLSIDVGHVLGEASASELVFGFRNADNTANLGAGGSASNLSIAPGTFQTFSTTYTATGADEGQPINVWVYDFYASGADLRVDNVTLTDNSIPIPDVPLATTTTVRSSINGANLGAPVALIATIATSGGAPSGTVTFFDGATNLGNATAIGGVATLTTSALDSGTHSITASYAGTVYHAASSSPAASLTVSVNQNIGMVNSSFEDGTSTGYIGGTTLNNEVIPGWGLNPGGQAYGNVTDVSALFPGNRSGSKALYINGGDVAQTTGGTFVAGRTYVFTVDIGNPNAGADASAVNGLYFGFRNAGDSGYLADNFIDAAVITALPAGTFGTFAVTYTATASDAGVPIRVGITDFFSTRYYYVDNFAVGLVPVSIGFTAWASGFGLAEDSDAADADGDGVANLLEYAQGSSPVSALSGAQPIVVNAVDGANSYLRLTTTKNPDATDLTYTVESSGDLITWSAAQTVVLTNTATSLIVRDSIATGTQPKRFLRLNVTR